MTTNTDHLKYSLIYTPRNREELNSVKANFETARSQGDHLGIMIGLAQITQGNELAQMEGW